MLKRLGIVTSSADVGKEYTGQLSKIFSDTVEFVTYSFEQSTKEAFENIDALLISTYSQYEVLEKHIDRSVNVVICRLTLSRSGYNLLKHNTLEKRAALVNLNFEMCIETIATLYQLGFSDYELLPIYPNMLHAPEVNYAITTGEACHVPKSIDKVIDLGHRVIDKNTIVDLAIALDLEDVLTEKAVLDYFSKLVSYNRGYDYFISKSKVSKNQFNALLSIMEKGVIGFGAQGRIESFNDEAKRLLNLKAHHLGKPITEVIPFEIYDEYCISKMQLHNKLVRLNDKHITLSIFPVLDIYESDLPEEATGSYAIFESFEIQEDTQNKLRLQLADKGHIAKYTVDSIIGESGAMCHVRELTARMGNSQSAVLVTGESGTGKELIAQALHNASPIRDKQFVAINCAALSPNLLESELFGYEAGAFTGALKGGKPGIFELAHNGSLFLDEIGEMPLELQVRLLRVLQEKEVMRVGGNKIIKVNVRIIAATNRDLIERVQSGEFRKDLYYRLNVLPIHVPPLRERGDDILQLIEYFKCRSGCDFSFSNEVVAFLSTYHWDGNIRELRNCIEYFDNMGLEVITMDHLPYHMQVQKVKQESRPLQRFANLGEKESYILSKFYEAFKVKKKLGRKRLAQIAYDEGMFLSEYDIRSILVCLKDLGYIHVETGRGGSTISRLGIEIVEL